MNVNKIVMNVYEAKLSLIGARERAICYKTLKQDNIIFSYDPTFYILFRFQFDEARSDNSQL